MHAQIKVDRQVGKQVGRQAIRTAEGQAERNAARQGSKAGSRKWLVKKKLQHSCGSWTPKPTLLHCAVMLEVELQMATISSLRETALPKVCQIDPAH